MDQQYRSVNDRKYIFPGPGIFIGANPIQQAKYFLTWQALEPACIHRLLSSTAPPLSNQDWRDILISNLEFKSSDSACAKAQQHTHHLLGSAIDDLHLNVTDPAASPPPPISDTEAWVMLWHLSELNFRFELLTYTSMQGQQGTMQLIATKLFVMPCSSPPYRQLTCPHPLKVFAPETGSLVSLPFFDLLPL